MFTGEIDAYILSHIDEEGDLLSALNRDANVNLLRPRMLSGHLQGRILKMFCRMIRPRRVLEIGTYTSYATLCMAEGMEEGALIHTIEINDEMEDFSLNPASPNAVAGGKIPLSCMSPTFVLKEGKPFAVVGSPGGTRIISTVSQVITHLIDHEMGLEEAIATPRIGDDDEDYILYETRIPEDVIEQLKRMGHRMEPCADWDRVMGSLNGVQYGKNGRIYGAADPRRDGFAFGV